jgi:hypothetical protein
MEKDLSLYFSIKTDAGGTGRAAGMEEQRKKEKRSPPRL